MAQEKISLEQVRHVARLARLELAPAEEQRMSLIEHLEALRRALIVALAAWAVATVAAFFISGQVIGLLVRRAGIGHAYYLPPARRTSRPITCPEIFAPAAPRGEASVLRACAWMRVGHCSIWGVVAVPLAAQRAHSCL